MGLFSKIFGGHKITTAAASVSFLQTYSGGSGGWGLARFNSVVDAHSSPEEIVEEFEINGEESKYQSPDGYPNCWQQAYQEELEKAQEEAAVLEVLGIEDIDVQDLIDWDAVEQKAWDYACELVQDWLDGSEWIPEEIMDYAWYGLSGHNV